MMHSNDEKFINLALNLAYKNIGTTSENPVVACVIVKDNLIIATGVTAQGGRPHAEINAINQVPDKSILKGASLYVTLEPCFHFGKTAPCVNEIIKYQFSRVIICAQDPDYRVNGKSIQLLREAKINVELGFKENEARLINKAFFKSKNYHKPFITLKIATSLDGKIATQNYHSKWITSATARQFSHYLRAKNQAIMVGANTVRIDNPELNCRINGLEKYSPTKIIISDNLNFSFKENIFTKNLSTPTIILCPSNHQNNPQLKEWLDKDSNNKAIFCDKINGKIDLNYALKKLCEDKINSILIEGGQSIITQFLSQNLFDELVWIRSKKIIGNDGISSIGNLGLTSIEESLRGLELLEIKNCEEDILEIFRNNLSNI